MLTREPIACIYGELAIKDWVTYHSWSTLYQRWIWV